MRTKLDYWEIPNKDNKEYVLLSDCTLAIPTYKRAHKIPELLNSLLKIKYIPKEVLIIDGSGDDLTLNKVIDFCKNHPIPFNLKVIKSPSGLTIQRNVAVDIAEGNYLFFFDDDCEPIGHYFLNIYNTFNDNPDVGAVNGLIINEINQSLGFKNKLRYSLHLYRHSYEPRKYYKFGTSVPAFTIKEPFNGTKEIDIVSGGACAWNLNKLKEIGGFSEFFIGYAQGEDLESSLRMRKKYRILWCGNAHCLHLHENSGRPNLYIKGTMEVYNRHYIWTYLTDNKGITDNFKFWLDVFVLNITYALLLLVKSGFKLTYVQLVAGYINGTFKSLFKQNPFITNRTIFFGLK